MKTTALIIEYLVSGILLMAALLLLAYSIFPQDVQKFFLLLKNSKELAFVISSVFAAIAYALGMLIEPIARIVFERLLHDRIEKERVAKYIEAHRTNLHKSSIFKKYKANNNIPSAKEAKSIIGEMRFYVLMQSSGLYDEIESQINRLRLIRILFSREEGSRRTNGYKQFFIHGRVF